MGERRRKAIGIGVVRFPYFQGLDEAARSVIIGLHDVVVLVVASQQNSILEVQTVRRNGGTAYLTDRPTPYTHVPYLDSAVPSSAEEYRRVFGEAFDAEDAVSVVVE